MNPKWVTNPERRVPRRQSTTSEPSRDETNNHDRDVPSDSQEIDVESSNTIASTRSDDYGTINALTQVYQQALGASQVPRRQSQDDRDLANGNTITREARRQRVLAILQRALEVCGDGNASENAEINSEDQ
jgi:hypothetical protein